MNVFADLLSFADPACAQREAVRRLAAHQAAERDALIQAARNSRNAYHPPAPEVLDEWTRGGLELRKVREPGAPEWLTRMQVRRGGRWAWVL